ncbi:hypothetical protein ACQEVF_56825 [Nonomuraea polychroma]|uniref:hypothetical protein n=1 Tax=Nonomuraea polychroma TaxID=46176 RepID=UPI003D8D8895
MKAAAHLLFNLRIPLEGPGAPPHGDAVHSADIAHPTALDDPTHVEGQHSMTNTHHSESAEPASDEFTWERHEPTGSILRVGHTSCCGAFELASEGGQYVVLRPTDEPNVYEETGRGRYRTAVAAYITLVYRHRRGHKSRGETPEFDPLLDGRA